MSYSNLNLSKNLGQNLKVNDIQCNTLETVDMIVLNNLNVVSLDTITVSATDVNTVTLETTLINGFTLPDSNFVGVTGAQVITDKTMDYNHNTFLNFPNSGATGATGSRGATGTGVAFPFSLNPFIARAGNTGSNPNGIAWQFDTGQTASTYINVSNRNDPGNFTTDNAIIFRAQLTTGRHIWIQSVSDSANYQQWLINAPYIDNTTYLQLPVTFIDGAGIGLTDFPPSAQIALLF